jgi:death-on-curing protein
MVLRLTYEHIVTLHDMALLQYGGLPGVKDEGYIHLVVDKPFSEFFGEEQYPGIFLKAAVYWHGLATAHCFNDGNKRTALMTALVFLQINGYELAVEDDVLFDVCIQVATKQLDLHGLARWIENQFQ